MIIAITLSTPALAASENEGLAQLDITTWPTQIFWLIVTFSLAYLLMWRVVLPNIASVLDERHSRLNDDLERAKQATDEAESMRVAFEQQLEDARQEALQKNRETLAEATAEAEKKNEAAASKLATKLEKAEANIRDAKDAALKELDDVSAMGAIEAVGAIAGIKIAKADAKKSVKKLSQKESD